MKSNSALPGGSSKNKPAWSNACGYTATPVAGTLEITAADALPTGSSLAVGTGATLIFEPSAAGSPDSKSAAAVAVPEPGTLVLLVAGAALLAMHRQRR